MKAISKRQEPKSLTEHRAAGGDYTGLDKAETRTSLLAEQGQICCYCMKRIPERGKTPGSKIEHFLCQRHHRGEELNYSNMLLACLGNEGSPKHLQTCDTRKGDASLSYNPSNRGRNIERLIKYTSDGEIYSDDARLDQELNDVLNLNSQTLKLNRKNFFRHVRDKIILEGKKQKNKALTRKFLESEKASYLAINGSANSEYCMVAVYIINKKLQKL
ncbi:MAG: hypothetical protein MJA30_04160 [Cytophagales bacterium]|nr:hypothetical protein [Cytophagales bacterium]